MIGEAAADILVVDDSPSKRYVITSWLRRDGHRVIEAATGLEALRLLHGGPDGAALHAELVVLDVRLPDIDGFEVAERIKEDPRTTAVPVIHISATAVHVVDRTQGLNRGADAYLAEPIDPDELLATVRAKLREYRARRRAERLAGRLTRLVDTTTLFNAATTLPDLLVAATSGAARVFEDRPPSPPDPRRPVRSRCRSMPWTAIRSCVRPCGGPTITIRSTGRPAPCCSGRRPARGGRARCGGWSPGPSRAGSRCTSRCLPTGSATTTPTCCASSARPWPWRWRRCAATTRSAAPR
ncbi:response regulator transcription factor [Dactylosporangium cerinum]